MTLRVVYADSKHAAESRVRGFDVTMFCTNFWMPGLIVPAGYCGRPAPAVLAEALGYGPRFGPDGYEYKANVIGGGAYGQAGKREPAWGADAVTDGSLVWVRQPISAASLFRTIIAPLAIEWLTEDDGMTITDQTYVLGPVLHVAARHSGGVPGETHRVIARIPFSDSAIEDYAIDWTILDDELGD